MYSELKSKRFIHYERHNCQRLLQQSLKARVEIDFIATFISCTLFLWHHQGNKKFTLCLFCLIMIVIIDTHGIQIRAKGIKRL